eukprot:1970015-Pyramimonas_sp.AAC.1
MCAYIQPPSVRCDGRPPACQAPAPFVFCFLSSPLALLLALALGGYRLPHLVEVHRCEDFVPADANPHTAREKVRDRKPEWGRTRTRTQWNPPPVAISLAPHTLVRSYARRFVSREELK